MAKERRTICPWSLFLMASLFSLTSETLSFLMMIHMFLRFLFWIALKIIITKFHWESLYCHILRKLSCIWVMNICPDIYAKRIKVNVGDFGMQANCWILRPISFLQQRILYLMRCSIYWMRFHLIVYCLVHWGLILISTNIKMQTGWMRFVLPRAQQSEMLHWV